MNLSRITIIFAGTRGTQSLSKLSIEEQDPLVRIKKAITKNPFAFKNLELHELKLLRASCGQKIDSLEDFIQEVATILHVDLIELPITRQGYKKVCKAMHRQCSEQQAIEAILACRGPQGDTS